jgi:1,4-dihydroxy-2-naphthoyl-CoA hydrolase
MPFTYTRTIHFRDTDAAGVVYFANVLSMCHEAYEASLAAAAIDLKQFFTKPAIAFPIAHADVDFFRPMQCGEAYCIRLNPKLINESKFQIDYEVFLEKTPDQFAAKATTHHVCIDAIARVKTSLPAAMHQWLKQFSQASSPQQP